MYDFQTGSHGPERDVERERVAYDGLLANYEALRLAADEGVFLVTIQTQRGSLTVPVSYLDGKQIAITLAERQADWIGHIEKALNYSLEAVGDEVRFERKDREARQQALSKFPIPLPVAPTLAEEAAASAALPQRNPVGRPRKKVAETLGQAAAAVPMNGTTQQPTSRASSTPQG